MREFADYAKGKTREQVAELVLLEQENLKWFRELPSRAQKRDSVTSDYDWFLAVLHDHLENHTPTDGVSFGIRETVKQVVRQLLA